MRLTNITKDNYTPCQLKLSLEIEKLIHISGPVCTFCEVMDYIDLCMICCFRVLCDYLHLLEKWKIEYAPKLEEIEWHPRFVEALQEISYTEYPVDILLYGDVSERAFLIIDNGEKVLKLEERIRTITAGNVTGIETDNGGNGTAENRK